MLEDIQMGIKKRLYKPLLWPLFAISSGIVTLMMPSAIATEFTLQEVDQSQFIAIASPYGNNEHQLLIVEQIPGKQKCWQEIEAQVAAVDAPVTPAAQPTADLQAAAGRPQLIVVDPYWLSSTSVGIANVTPIATPTRCG
jgi:hypothetical protein